MNNDLISRSALQRCLQAELDAAKDVPEKAYAKAILDVLIDVKLAPTVDAEPVRHDGCALCNIKETGHGVIAFYGIGWQVCINKRGKNYYLVMGHEGSQTEMLIGYCPACGAKMDGDKDATD